MPLADLLRTCLVLAGRTRAAQLREWATAELKGYRRIDAVPDYRKIAAPILRSFDVPAKPRSTGPIGVFSGVST
jgi:hypothetical protein